MDKAAIPTMRSLRDQCLDEQVVDLEMQKLVLEAEMTCYEEQLRAKPIPGGVHTNEYGHDSELALLIESDQVRKTQVWMTYLKGLIDILKEGNKLRADHLRKKKLEEKQRTKLVGSIVSPGPSTSMAISALPVVNIVVEELNDVTTHPKQSEADNDSVIPAPDQPAQTQVRDVQSAPLPANDPPAEEPSTTIAQENSKRSLETDTIEANEPLNPALKKPRFSETGRAASYNSTRPSSYNIPTQPAKGNFREGDITLLTSKARWRSVTSKHRQQQELQQRGRGDHCLDASQTAATSTHSQEKSPTTSTAVGSSASSFSSAPEVSRNSARREEGPASDREESVVEIVAASSSQRPRRATVRSQNYAEPILINSDSDSEYRDDDGSELEIISTSQRAAKEQKPIIKKKEQEEASGSEKKLEEDQKSMKSKEKQKVEVRPYRNQLPSDIVTSRLDTIGNRSFTINELQTFLHSSTTRKVLSQTFGGGEMNTFCNVRPQTLEDYQVKRFVCPKRSQNHGIPEVPGTPGLFMRSSRHESDLVDSADHLETVVVGLESGVWLYLGIYRFRKGAPLSVEEWKVLPVSIRKAWIRAVKNKKSGINQRTRMSILCRRKLGLTEPPNLKRISAMIIDVKENRVIDDVDEDEIAEAYDSGHEQINVWVMECVGYNRELQQAIITANGD